MIASLLLAAVLTGTPPAPEASPPPAAEASRYTAWSGRRHSFTGDAKDDGWSAGVEVDAPLVLGSRPRARLLVDLSWSALPQTRIDIANPETWGDTGELSIGLGVPVGLWDDSASARRHRTLAVARWGFAAALGRRPLDRYSRLWVAGLRFESAKAGAEPTVLEVTWGRCEAAGFDFGRGQLVLRGRFPLGPSVGGAQMVLLGEAFLNVLGATGQGREVYRLAVGLVR